MAKPVSDITKTRCVIRLESDEQVGRFQFNARRGGDIVDLSKKLSSLGAQRLLSLLDGFEESELLVSSEPFNILFTRLK
jgi:hypothetical protein